MEKGDAGRLEIVTLRDAVGNKKLNDLAYQYDLLLLSIVEHQSTWSENMPLRELAYLEMCIRDRFSTESVDTFAFSISNVATLLPT